MREVTIKGNSYKIAFNIRALNEFAKSQGVELVSDAVSSLSFLRHFKKGYKLRIDDFEKIVDVAFAAIEAGAKKQKVSIDLTKDDVYEELIKDTVQITPIIEDVVECITEYLEAFNPEKKNASKLKKTA